MANDEGEFMPTWLMQILATLAGLGFLGLFGWHLNDVKQMSERLAVTANRTDQIAEALPDMGRFFAREELNDSIGGVLVMTFPIVEDDSWFRYAYFADALEGQQRIYTLSLSGENDFAPSYSVIGAVDRLGGIHHSFTEMAAWSADVDEPATFSSMFDTDSSFIFRGDSHEALQKYLADYAGPPTTISLEHRPTSWPAVLVYTNDDIANALYERRDKDEE
jgi:hypothetical protein